jgi:hypothetical protein
MVTHSERALAELALHSARFKVQQARSRVKRARLRWAQARVLLRRTYRSAKIRARQRWKDYRRAERERVNRQIAQWKAEFVEEWRQRKAKLNRAGLSVVERSKEVALHERDRLRELAAHKRRVAQHVARHEAKERASESDDTVIADLEAHHPELVPVFRKIRAQIKASPRRSRTEAMLEWAEENPDEVASMTAAPELQDLQKAIREHEEAERREHEEREAARAVTGRRDYATRKAARIERLRERAGKARAASEQAERAARERSEMIPLGQPILVGHHSERRHRRDIGKIQHGYQVAAAEAARARRLEERAKSAEKSKAISSDDPEAAEKIRAKILDLERQIAMAGRINAALKRHKKDPSAARPELEAMGLRPATIEHALKPDYRGRVGVPKFTTTNAQSEIRRLRYRLDRLEEAGQKQAAAKPISMGDVRIEQEDNRVRIFFPGKPDEEIRRKLKSHGFKWSPMAGAWQRLWSEGAIYQAKRIVGEYNAPRQYAAASGAPF